MNITEMIMIYAIITTKCSVDITKQTNKQRLYTLQKYHALSSFTLTSFTSAITLAWFTCANNIDDVRHVFYVIWPFPIVAFNWVLGIAHKYHNVATQINH